MKIGVKQLQKGAANQHYRNALDFKTNLRPNAKALISGKRQKSVSKTCNEVIQILETELFVILIKSDESGAPYVKRCFSIEELHWNSSKNFTEIIIVRKIRSVSCGK